MKLFAKSTNGKMLKIGDTPQTASFYFMTDAVKSVIDNFKMGEDVEIQTKSENGYEWITSLNKPGTVVQTPTPVKPVPSTPKATPITTGAKPDVGVTTQKTGYLPKEEWIAKMKAEGKWNQTSEKKTYGKSPEEQESIKKQAIVHAVSRAMISMQGIITPDNMEEISEKLYRKFQELVG